MPRARWDALVRGEGCPLCADLAGDVRVNDHVYTVADLSVSRLWPATNQWVRGYSVLVFRRHVREPYELDREERVAFFEDAMRAGAALERAFGADKLNFNILGNAVPHLHCHLLPRYYGDPAPGRPIDPSTEVVRLSPEEYEARAVRIRVALGGSFLDVPGRQRRRAARSAAVRDSRSSASGA